MANIHNLGEVVGRSSPGDEPWLIEIAADGRECSFTFGALHRDADAVARGLLNRGLKRGESVGILAANRAEYLIAYIGIMRAGLVAVPINFKLPRDIVAHIFGDSKIKFVLVDEERAGLVGAVPAVRMDQPVAWRGLLDPGPFVSPDMRDEEFATILYTSGSSGRSKGVPLTHGGYVWATDVLSASGPTLRGKRALVAAPLYHMNGLLQSLVTSVAGGSVVLLCRFIAGDYLEVAARLHCHVLTSVPTMLALVARETEALERLDLSHVETVVTGSAPSTEALFDRIARIFPNARVMNFWGTTESSPVAFGPHPEGLLRPKLSIGYPVPEAELKLVGGSNEDEGVLWVRNRAVTPGYLNLPGETAIRIRDGWYDTGDVMRRDAGGFYYFVGRVDDMFVCGGENIYPGEVEKLLEKHSGIAQAVVVPVPDEIKGQIPVAFVVRQLGANPSAEEIKKYALENAPAYQHPRFVEFMTELPLAGTNKVDRQALTQRASQEFRR